MDPAQLRTINLICTSYDQKTSGVGQLKDLSPPERLTRAGKVAAIGFTCTLLALLIPFLHFFLVPLFGLGTIALSALTWLESSELCEGSAPCPNCEQVNHLKNESNSWPKEARCAHCSFLLKWIAET